MVRLMVHPTLGSWMAVYFGATGLEHTVLNPICDSLTCGTWRFVELRSLRSSIILKFQDGRLESGRTKSSNSHPNDNLLDLKFFEILTLVRVERLLSD
ncbi:hypothetical protein TNCV_5110861 [Trichonephila clavipes]|nr:hypothetical protein TNCV_5110861 [Trichonephila clavipes]